MQGYMVAYYLGLKPFRTEYELIQVTKAAYWPAIKKNSAAIR